MKYVLEKLTIVVFILSLMNIVVGCNAHEKELTPPHHPLTKIDSEEGGVSHGYTFADDIINYNGTENSYFPRGNALNGVQGYGESSGSQDVFVFGDGKEATFRWKGKKIVNGEGDDFKVFENGFIINGTNRQQMAMDLATVEVSKDGEKWIKFPVTYSDQPYINSVEGKSGFVGLKCVFINFIKEKLLDPASNEAGGDAFDLSDVGISQGDYIKYVKIVDGGSQYPDGQPGSNGVDIDGVCAFHWQKD